MQKISIAALSLLAGLFLVSNTHAGLLEIRAGAGLNASNPDDFEDQVQAISGSDLNSDSFSNYNADVFLNLPGPLGVGLRQEWLNQDQSSGGNKWEIDANNLSLLVDLRLMDNWIYLGPLVTIGYPWGDLNVSGSKSDFDSGNLSYGLAAEAGVKLSMFILGAEAGYQSLELKTKDNGSGVNANVDLSGFYGKIMIGVTFL